MAPPCRFFALGTCRNGAACPFSHDSSAAAAPPQSKVPCKFFALGTCRFGAGCMFSHDAPDADPAAAYGYAPRPAFYPQQFPRPFGRPQQQFAPQQAYPPQFQPQNDYDEDDDDSPPPQTPVDLGIRPGMSFEQIMALKASHVGAEFRDRQGVFDPNVALDALEEHVAAVRDYLAGIARRCGPAGSDPHVLSRTYPKPTGSFAAIKRVFDRLKQSKMLEVEGGKVDDGGFVVLISIGDMDEQVRSLGIVYGGSAFPVPESGWISLVEYAAKNCDPEMQEMIAAVHSRFVSRNPSFGTPRVVVSLEDDYETHPLPSPTPSPLVAGVLNALSGDPTKLHIPPECTRADVATLLTRIPADNAVAELRASNVPALTPSDLARLFSALPNLERADLSSNPKLTGDAVHALARACPGLKLADVRGHPTEDHSSLDESVLTALGHGTTGCRVECGDQFWLGKGFVAGVVADVWKGRGGGPIVVGEGGEEEEI
ncbi:hypothetical protein DFJ74DRAFT_766808 [Hyaloraphidium curvatum]|nr:hypothetical protein DFJ74DRAFT_766808 [Hyaloraphidium curvatum]